MDPTQLSFLLDLAPGVPPEECQPLIEAALAAKGVPPPLRMRLKGQPEHEVAALGFADAATVAKFLAVPYYIVDGRIATPSSRVTPLPPRDIHRVFIGNLPFSATNNTILEVAIEGIAQRSFSARDLQGVRVCVDKESGRSRGFAFLTAYSAAAAEAVKDALNEVPFDGRRLRCDIAQTVMTPAGSAPPPAQQGFATPSAADLTSRFGQLNVSTPAAATSPQRIARAFTMELYPGKESEYKKRHDEIWPDLSAVLKAATISNYNIFRHGTTLFAFYECTEEAAVGALKDNEVVQRWWAFMAPLMKCNPDNSPITTPLASMFHLP